MRTFLHAALLIVLGVLLVGFASCGFEKGEKNFVDTDGDGIADAKDKCPAVPYTPQTIYFQPLTNAPANPGPTDFMMKPDPTSPTGFRVNLPAEYFQSIDLGDIETLLRELGLDEETIQQLMQVIVETIGRIMAHTFNGLDGLSTTGDIVVYLSAEPDPATVNDRTVRVVNVNQNSPHYLESAPVQLTVETITGDTETPDKFRLKITPAEPLYSRTQYLVLLTDGIKTACGENFEPSADMKQLLSTSAVAGPLESSRREYQDYINLVVRKLGIKRSQISLLFSLTTQTVAEDLVAIREAARKNPPSPVSILAYFPPLTSTGEVNWYGFNDGVRDWPGFFTIDLDNDGKSDFPELPDDVVIHSGYFTNIALIVYGSFPSPSYLNEEKVFEGDPVTFEPQEFGMETREFLLALPQKAQSGPVPVIVFGHALGVCKETLIAIADTFARHGFATMGIDAIGHGSRSLSGVECGQNVDLATAIMPLIYLDIQGNTIDANLLSIRDIFRQTAADEIQFVQMIRGLTALDLDLMPMDDLSMGDGVLDLDTSWIGFCSQSLGSVIGGSLIGVENDLQASVLNVGGGYFSDFVSIFLGEFMAFIPNEVFVGVQWVMDGADPINYMRAVTREPFPGITGAKRRSLLLQEAVNDDTVPNQSTENLARVARADLVWPYIQSVPGLSVKDAPLVENLGPGVTAGLFQFHPAEHEFLLMPDNLALTMAGQEQAAIFFQTARSSRNGGGTIINTWYSVPPLWQ